MATFVAWKMQTTYKNRVVKAVQKLSALQKISFDFGWQTETMLSAVEWLTILTKHGRPKNENAHTYAKSNSFPRN